MSSCRVPHRSTVTNMFISQNDAFKISVCLGNLKVATMPQFHISFSDKDKQRRTDESLSCFVLHLKRILC